MAELNRAQRAAVEHGDGPLLVLAGAGSGKTRVITQRVASLIGRGVAPERILAVSFTNKAAEELVERMVPLVGRPLARKIWMSTFHSFGLRFAQEEKQALKLGKRFVIFDQGDSLGMVKEILRELRMSGAARKLDPMAVLARVSSWKSSLVAPDEVPESDFEYDDVAREVYPEYEARMRAMCALDFDDLCVLPVRALRQNEALHQRWRDKFDHLLVDEFQDTSKVQLELCKLLANDRRNVCVVGDDDQSIYAFRGAEVGNILDFDRHFGGATIVKLEDNYRSREAVIAVANAAIAQSAQRRHDKTLRAARGKGDKVRLCVLDDPADEAKLVAKEARELIAKGQAPHEIAVLYRSNLQARPIEEELRLQGIEYQLFGGTRFFDRREVKDVVAYVRALLLPNDEVSLRRVINQPPRGIGPKTVERIAAHAETLGVPFPRALADAVNIADLSPQIRASVTSFSGMLDKHRKKLTGGHTLAQITRELAEDAGLRTHLAEDAEGGAAGPLRWANIEHLFGWIERMERDQGRDRNAMRAALDALALGRQNEDEKESKGVTLSTLHGVKGLEFEVVFLIGCVEGQLPHSRTTDPKLTEVHATDIDEERRLFYVGVTRARDRLYLTRFRNRSFRGKSMELVPSRFLEGLPAEHLEVYERPEKQELAADEIAALGREFLQKRMNAQRR
jgi:superfamily I DNA/RNA helicase